MSREKLDDDEEDDDDSEDEQDPDRRVIKGRKGEEGARRREREREGGGGQEAIGTSDRISLVNQIWPNKRRDGRNAKERMEGRENSCASCVH